MNEFQESAREQVFVVAILSRRWFRSGAFFISATNLHHSYRLHPRAFPPSALFFSVDEMFSNDSLFVLSSEYTYKKKVVDYL